MAASMGYFYYNYLLASSRNMLCCLRDLGCWKRNKTGNMCVFITGQQKKLVFSV